MKILVIGAGAMGSGIAQVLSQAGEHVAVYDTKPEMLEKAEGRLAQTLETLVAKGKFTADEAAGIRSRIVYTDNLRDGEGAELAIEAIYKSIETRTTVTVQA